MGRPRQASPQQKWKELTAGFQAAAVNFGTEMLPAFTKAAGFADHILADLNGSKGAWKDVAIGAGGLAALFTGKKLVSGIECAFQTGETALRGIGKLFNIPGLSNIGKGASGAAGAAATDTAAEGLSGAASALDGAAASLEGAAASLKGSAATGGVSGAEGAAARGAGEGEAAAGGAAAAGAGAEGAAAAEGGAEGSILSKLIGSGGIMAGIRAAAGPLALGLTIGEVTKAAGDYLAPKGTTAGTMNQMLQKTPVTNDSAMMPSVFGGFEAKLAQEIGMPVGAAIGKVLSQKAPQSPAAIQQSGLGAASAMRFGGGTTDATPARTAAVPAPQPENLLGGAGRREHGGDQAEGHAAGRLVPRRVQQHPRFRRCTYAGQAPRAGHQRPEDGSVAGAGRDHRPSKRCTRSPSRSRPRTCRH